MHNILKAMIGFVGMAVISSVTAEKTVCTVFAASTEQQEQAADNTDSDTVEEEIVDVSEAEEKEEAALKKPVLYAFSKAGGRIQLKWGKIGGAAEYVLYRSKEKKSGYHQIYKNQGEICNYIDERRTTGEVYYYQLAVFSKGRKDRSDSKITAGRSLKRAELSEISNLSGSCKLVLHWKHVTGASEYQIQRKSKTGQYKIIASVNSKKTTFTDTKLTGGKFYTYRVCAKDAGGGRGNYSKSLSQMAIDSNKKMIALTYDDGPSKYTPVVLDALEKYGAHATFFVVGNRVNNYGDSIRRETAMGCEIGNHTYAHNNLKSLSTPQVQSVLNATNQAVKKQSGFDIRIMRPPGGGYDSAVCTAAGMPVILWSVDTLDWKTRSASATIQCVKQKAHDGAVVLMHDLHQPTANAADAVISYLKSAGYQMVTVSELAAYRGGMTAGKVYSQFGK